MKINLIVAAGGQSSRAKTDKLFAKMQNGKSVLYNAITPFFSFPEVTLIIIAAPLEKTSKIKDEITQGGGQPETSFDKWNNKSDNLSLIFCAGGETRAHSVYNALAHTEDECDIVLIHDGARPFVSAETIKKVIEGTKKYGGCVPYRVPADTARVKTSGGAAYADRHSLMLLSTPQGFLSYRIKEAYEKNKDNLASFTDDSSIYENVYGAAYYEETGAGNIKLTTPEDIKLFCGQVVKGRANRQALYHSPLLPNGEKTKTTPPYWHPSVERDLDAGHWPLATDHWQTVKNGSRIGIGYDIHNLIEPCSGQKGGIVLGGVKIPHDKAFQAHSDGDVLLHSLTDALLLAMGKRDIGYYFPDTDPRYKGVDSVFLLKEVIRKITGGSDFASKDKILETSQSGKTDINGFSIANISAIIIAEQPYLSPYIEQIRMRLSSLLELPIERIAVAAKTNEGNGDVGKGKAIAAHTSVLLQKGKL